MDDEDEIAAASPDDASAAVVAKSAQPPPTDLQTPAKAAPRPDKPKRAVAASPGETNGSGRLDEKGIVNVFEKILRTQSEPEIPLSKLGSLLVCTLAR